MNAKTKREIGERKMMRRSNKGAARAVLLAALTLGLGATAFAQKDEEALTPGEAKAKQAYAIGVQAYIWYDSSEEPFYMLMRMYLPDIEALNGQYELPGVVKAK